MWTESDNKCIGLCQILAESGQTWHNILPSWDTLDQCRTDLGRCWAEVGPNCSKFYQLGPISAPKLGRAWDKLDQHILPISPKSGLTSADFGRNRPNLADFDRAWTALVNLGMFRPSVDRFGPRLDRVWTYVGQIWAEFGQCRTAFGPEGQLGWTW